MQSALTVRTLAIIEELVGSGHFGSGADMRVDVDRFPTNPGGRAGPLRAARPLAGSFSSFLAIALRLPTVAERARCEGWRKPERDAPAGVYRHRTCH
jgi:hypothetical protein